MEEANQNLLLYTIKIFNQVQTYMIVVLGVITISVLLFCKLKFLFSQHTANFGFLFKLANYSTMDKVARIIQYSASFLVYSITTPEPFYYNHILSQLHTSFFPSVNQLIQLQLLMSHTRKILRFYRCLDSISSLLGIVHKVKSRAFQTKVIEIDSIIWGLGDITDIIFYFTDHFHAFYMLGLVSSKDLNYHLFYIGDVMWIIGAFCFFTSSACKEFYPHHYTLDKNEQRRLRKINILQMVYNSWQFFLGFCFLDPDLIPRNALCIIVLISTSTKMVSIWQK